MDDTTLFISVFHAVKACGLGLLSDDYDGTMEVLIEGMVNVPEPEFYWNEVEENIHLSVTYEFEEGIPDDLEILDRLSGTVFTEAISNDAETLLVLSAHFKKDDITKEKVEEILKNIADLPLLKELKERSMSDHYRANWDAFAIDKVRDYLVTHGRGRVSAIRRALGITKKEILACIDVLKKQGIVSEDEDYEFILK